MASMSSDESTPSMPSAVHQGHPSLQPISSSSSASSSESESEPAQRSARLERPRLQERVPSGPIVVPKSQVYVRDSSSASSDRRAMSPRRSSEDLQRLSTGARHTLYEHAKSLQSSLSALADKIDEVKSDYDRMENENRFLQDYIGGLTKTMSKRDLGSSSRSKK